jgi:uncharacterized membrane protein YdjX (TVP38/TMEM64 family)
MTPERKEMPMKSEPPDSGYKSAPDSRQHGLWRLGLLVAIIVVFIVLARVFDIGSRLQELRAWILSLGSLGPLVYIFIYAVAVVLTVPGSFMTVMAGVLFGSALGVATVSAASTLGASLAFLIARYVARKAITQKFGQNEKFRRLDRLTREHGSIIVAITRLIPLFPFTLLNYGFGLTGVSFWTYVFWSWLCMLPMTVVFVLGADAVTRAAAEGKVPWMLIGVISATIGIIIVLVRQARKKIKEG